MTVKLVVDWDLCQGHGACVLEAPEVFRLEADGSLEILVESPPEELRTKVVEAARQCPSYALTVADGTAS